MSSGVLFLAIAVSTIVVFVGGYILKFKMAERRRQRRFDLLLAKYNDEAVVNKIMTQVVWQGASQDMILDMLGRPADIDEKVFKTKTKHVWKYFQRTKTQFGLRITFENGVVVGWDAK